ncbi:PREDICTED: cytochrome P450 2D14-like [Gekko japonicus]|uniref:Cytochrome P450 2D14-like n=1 Tax=Gekko japonicus TaxID=146911 RepID=A0ABM1L5Z3_GEKJA|nr:PREDICTED: cytochrome P450 2D14-like [Gekko japonicus]
MGRVTRELRQWLEKDGKCCCSRGQQGGVRSKERSGEWLPENKGVKRSSVRRSRRWGSGHLTLKQMAQELCFGPRNTICPNEGESPLKVLVWQRGAPFDPETLLTNAVGKIICTLTLGDHFDYNDATFLKLIHLTKEIMMILGAGFWLPYIPGPHQKIKKMYNDISALLTEIVMKHKETRDPTFARDMIDTFLEEMEKAKGNPESSFNEHNLNKTIIEMFVAGMETTTSTILWGLLKMVLHPEVQKQVHEEIEEVLGRDQPPTMEDQPNLPYTNAVIHEIQRCADIVPIVLPYITHQDVQIDKFVIPKETMVFNHLSSVLKDETMWEKPHQFYPEHFLDANGQFVKREAFLPFSAGRHACPGEQMAKMELFIFFTSLLQRFTFCIPENHPRPKEDRLFALTVTPAPFQICAIPR